MKLASVASLMLVLVTAVPAAAQSLTSDENREVIAGALTRSADATNRSAVRANTIFTLEGTTKDKVASGQIGFQRGDFSLSLGLKGQLDNSGESTFADLKGLRNKSTAELGVLWSHWTIVNPERLLTAACEQYSVAIAKKLEDINCSLLALRRDTSPAGRATLKRILRQIDPGTIYFAGGNVALGREKFKYVNVPDLTARTESHNSWSVTATGGVLTEGGILWAAHYTHEVAYQAGDQAQVCSPVGSAGSLQCANKVIGAPARDASEIIGGETRKFFGTRFAINPRLNVDLREKTTGVEVPLYFLRNSEGGLTGGVSVGWRSDNKELTVSAFVGQVLGLITR